MSDLQNWPRVKEIVDAALDLAPSERPTFLRETCGDDRALQTEVESLLMAHDRAGSFGEQSPLRALDDSAVASLGRTLRVGDRLGPYEIASSIGAGGMGEVYQAHDTRLHRRVAIKVLPAHVASDHAWRARFDREARAIAALSHPHICTLYDVGRDGDTAFLVMELVTGDTLAQRLTRGALPLDQALQIATQIAEALDVAHRAGIVHRDLKPGNIMLPKSGAKLLDFGLAKAWDAALGPSGAVDTVTAEGTIVGTLQYMAPEQLEGRAADARTDIFAFGAVVYEMLTGKKAFAGASDAAVISAIMQAEPTPISATTPAVPASLDRTVQKCLSKDPDRRWQSARDLSDELSWIAVGAAPPSQPRSRRLGTASLATLVIGTAAVAGLVWAFYRAPETSVGSRDVARVLVGVTPAEAFASRPTRTDVALSPDGKLLVFSGTKDDRQQLYLRALDRLEATPIAGTEKSNSPFFSPDGQWLAYWTGEMAPGSIGELKKIRLAGGPPVTLCNVAPLFGATWAPNDTIVFATVGEGGLQRVPAGGGTPQQLTRRGRLPHALPDGRAVLFTIVTSYGHETSGQIAVASLATGEERIVLDRGADGQYVASGHLVYVRAGTLMAVPFDLQGLRLTGTPTALETSVMQALDTGYTTLLETAAAQVSVSQSGSMIFVPAVADPQPSTPLVWVDRRGATTAIAAPARRYGGPRLSPDGRRIAVYTTHEGPWDSWIFDIGRGTLSRAAPPGTPAHVWPLWTRDGTLITLASRGLLSVPAEGGAVEPLLDASGRGNLIAGSWSPDGRTLAFTMLLPNGTWQIHTFSRAEGERKLHASVNSLERFPTFSPDGRWLAYSSNESGRDEIYVERFPGSTDRHMVSTDGGIAPAWAPDGRELFYLVTASETPRRTQMMAVDVKLEPTFSAGIPRMLFEGPYTPGTPMRHYDVSPDGRFLMLQVTEAPTVPVTQMVLVLNWLEELKRLAFK